MTPAFDAVVDTPVGFVGIVTDGDVVTRVVLAPPMNARYSKRASTVVAQMAVADLMAFFDDPNHSFKVPVAFQGTPFQQRVQRALRDIPVGETRTYGGLAKSLKTSARAVGGACRTNPCPIFVPCHRVVASGGKLGGFGGQTNGEWMTIKQRLLRLEGAAV